MQNNIFKKGLVIGIIVLFIGVGIIPNIVRVVRANTNRFIAPWQIDIPKGYYFRNNKADSKDIDGDTNNDIEIIISAGHYGLDIGTFLKIDVINNKDKNITIFYHFSSNYLFTNFRDGTFSWNSTHKGIGNYSSYIIKYFLGFGIDLFSITVECENNSVTRNGIWICVRFCILFN